MKIWYDTEFLEDGKTIRLISIGMIAGDGRQYYAVNREMPQIEIMLHDWLMANVVPSLPIIPEDLWVTKDPSNPLGLDWRSPLIKPHRLIAHEVSEFIRATPDPELWAWYGSYDHVALSQLWGRMIEHPPWVPMWTNDLRQEQIRLGVPDRAMPLQDVGQHNALADAKHNREMDEFLSVVRRWGAWAGGPEKALRLLNQAGFHDPTTTEDGS